jgi:endonuclease G, mitochondrial
LPLDEDKKVSNAPTKATETKGPKTLMGGWYPVFFDDYSSSKLTDVINNIKSGKVASIQIQYDRNENLANQIASQIESQTNLKVSPIQSSPPESPSVTYERNRVTLIIRSK